MKHGDLSRFPGKGVGPRWRSGPDFREWTVEIAAQWQRAIRCCPKCRQNRAAATPPMRGAGIALKQAS